MSCGCGCGGGSTTKPPLVIHVPGLQGPQGPEGTATKGAVRFDEIQSLNEQEKLQARQNIGACSVIELAEAQGFTTRFVSQALEPKGTYPVSILTPSTKVKAGDSVVDEKGQVFQIVKIQDSAFTITSAVAKVGGGVTDYNELTGKPTLGKLASLNEVNAENLAKTIDLGVL